MNDAGRIGFVVKGDYNNTATYEFLDVVYYNNATYVAKKLTVGNEPQSSSEFWQVLVNGEVDFNDIAPTFLQAETRENINSGEKLPVLFGKIKKFFADLKTVAFTGSYNDLLNKPSASDIGAVATSKVLDTAELISANTVSGNVAGALGVKQIKNDLNDSINTLNTNLQNTIYGHSESDLFERIKGVVEEEKIPTNKPFLIREGSYGISVLTGHVYNNYTYGGFLVITIGEVYYAKVSNGTLASLTKIPLSASDLGLGDIMTGFSNRTTGLWGAGGTELDNLNSGITVLSTSPKSEYANCDSWYYKTFYENGDNDKNYGIQIAIPRMKYTTILFRQKNNGSWGDWIEK